MPITAETLHSTAITKYYQKQEAAGYPPPPGFELYDFINGHMIYINEDPGWVGRMMKKLYGEIDVNATPEEYYRAYIETMVWCWKSMPAEQKEGLERLEPRILELEGMLTND